MKFTVVGNNIHKHEPGIAVVVIATACDSNWAWRIKYLLEADYERWKDVNGEIERGDG